ncbi:hypothetical protein [Komagataeibacter xylinus]|uniref:Uncharacterized protein n=1 Tax=Komagataeibacter xylinus TaxID=28448 RepID=A0A857FN15_KOMXY|nr:hypothetical protein [Komagataeibacter xylinus]QHC35661.1 hypothetical protein FMA36_09395 [Komagataeibacter xylinus]
MAADLPGQKKLDPPGTTRDADTNDKKLAACLVPPDLPAACLTATGKVKVFGCRLFFKKAAFFEAFRENIHQKLLYFIKTVSKNTPLAS